MCFAQRGSGLVPLLLLAGLLCGSPAQATVLQELSFEELVSESQLVFLGTVLRSETEIENGLVHTRVWFSVDDLIRGEAPEDNFSLRFVGGKSGDMQVEVAGQNIPVPGEHAVWFVRDVYDAMVNPLTGWHQGSFPVETQDDGTRVLDLSARPDLILVNMRADPLGHKMLNAGFSEEQIAAKLAEYQRFPLQDFVDAIRNVAEDSP